MNGKRKIGAIMMAAVVVMAVAVPMAFGDDENAATSATVKLSAGPVVNTVTVTPDLVTLTAGGTTTITVRAGVSHAEGYEQIDTVAITAIDPAIATVVPLLPISLTEQSGSGTDATYEGTFGIPYYTDPGPYTVTVTATDVDGGIGSNTGTFTVNELLAISVTDVGFGTVHPGGSAGTGSSTVTNEGNVVVVFVDWGQSDYNNNPNDGITWTDMTGETSSEIIPDTAITTTWLSATEINKGATGNTGDVPFSLAVPLGTAPDEYTGSATFTPSPV